MSTNKLGPRPEPHLIKFSADCFKVVGSRKYWTVSTPTGYGYPRRFNTYDEAVAARKGTQVITEHEEEIKERIKWF